jgi:ribosomal protein S18 acetylase RimI-like enzyme
VTDHRLQTARITVRPAVRADAPAIGAVFDAAVRAGWTYLGDLVHDPMFTPGDWDRVVADHAPPNVLVVAEHDTDGIVGFTAVHPGDGEMFLLFVHPDYSGRGIGRTLLTAAHDSLRAASCHEAFLLTHEHNERALLFYAAAGYHPDGTDRTSEFRGTHIREVRLVKPL